MDEMMTITIDNYRGKTITFTMPVETYVEIVTQMDVDYDDIRYFEIRAIGDNIKKEEEDKYQMSFRWER